MLDLSCIGAALRRVPRPPAMPGVVCYGQRIVPLPAGCFIIDIGDCYEIETRQQDALSRQHHYLQV